MKMEKCWTLFGFLVTQCWILLRFTPAMGAHPWVSGRDWHLDNATHSRERNAVGLGIISKVCILLASGPASVGQVYSFTGYLFASRSAKYQLLKSHNPYVFSSLDYREVADTIANDLLPRVKPWIKITQLMEYIAEYCGRQIKIGLDLTVGY